MSNPQQNQKAASEVLVRANTWLDCREAVQAAPEGEKARPYGRYKTAGRDLAQAVKKLRSVQP